MPRTVRTAPARKAAERTTAGRPAKSGAKRAVATAAAAKTPAQNGTGTSKDVMQTVQTAPAPEEIAGMDGLDAEAEAAALMSAEAPAEAPAPVAEVDLDDQTSTMGDSVHTYLKSIGRTSSTLLPAGSVNSQSR